MARTSAHRQERTHVTAANDGVAAEVVACRSTAIVPDGSQPFVMRWRHDDVRALRSLAWVGLVGVLVAGCASSSHPRASESLAGSAVSSPALGVSSSVASSPASPPPLVSSSLISSPLSSSPAPSEPGRPSVDPQSVSFVSASTGWLWGPGGCCAEQGYGPGTLAKTTDGGTSWQTVATPGIDYGQYGEPIDSGATGVRFVDDRHGYLFGDQLFVTSDGGATWRRQQTPGPVADIEDAAGTVYALVRDCPTAAACAAAQTATDRLFELSGDGATFTTVGPTGPVSDLSQLITHASSVFLLAPDTTVPGPTTLWTKLPDGSWQQQSTPCEWSGADFAAMASWSATGLALVCGSEPSAGNQPKVAYTSTDTGGHWHEVAAPDASGYVADLAAADARTWVLGEARGGMLVTHDGGRSWQDAAFSGELPWVEGWVGVTFVSATQAVASPWTLNGSALAITTDGARTWRAITFPSGR